MAFQGGAGTGKGGTGNGGKGNTPLKEEWPSLGDSKKQSTKRDQRNPWGTASVAQADKNKKSTQSPPDMGRLSLNLPNEASAPQPVPKAATTSKVSSTSAKLPPKDNQQSNDGMKKPDLMKEPSKALQAMTDTGTAVTYASHNPGNKAQDLTIRVNMLALPFAQSLTKIFVYAVSFPQISGRDLKNRKVKKEFIRAVLAQEPFKTYRADIATDWISFIIATKDLGHVDTSLAPGSCRSVSITWKNQASTQATSHVVDVKFVRDIDLAELQRYCSGNSAASVNLGPHVTALNILARKQATETGNNVKVGRDKFFYTQVPRNLGSGLEARRGFFASVFPAGNGAVMNVHSVSTAFIQTQKLLEYAATQINGFDLAGMTTDQAARAWDSSFRSVVKGREVRYLYIPPDVKSSAPQKSAILPTHPQGRERRVNGFGRSVSTQTFLYNGNAITVEQYYNRCVLRPGIVIKYPHLLAINTGSHLAGQETWVPPELLELVEDQAFGGMLGVSSMDPMLRFAQKTPLQNVTEIESCLRPNAMFSSQHLRHSGLNVSMELMKVSARMLDLPGLLYSNNGKVTSIRGGPGDITHSPLRSGRWDLRQKKFSAGAYLPTLAVLELEEATPDIRTGYHTLSSTLSVSGVNPLRSGERQVIHAAVNKPYQFQNAYDNLRNQAQKAHRFARDQILEVILVLMPGTDDKDPGSQELYSQIKTFFHLRLGVNTVCLKRKDVITRLGNTPFGANLALKFNVKSANGINHKLTRPFHSALHSKGTTMIMGADVTHPGVGAIPYCPSIAAVVASNGPEAVTFPGSLRLQRSKQEMIGALKDMVIERLEHWMQCNYKKLPDEILFYRDGVSDSQFSQVKNLELPQIKQACAAIAHKHRIAGYDPPVTLVVCGKRHHTRFYPSKDAVAKRSTEFPFDKSNNMNFAPGLLVEDKSIRNPYTFDFYLQSHKALNGTARPCHYFVIENGMNMTADRLQEITFGLCFNFATALTPISYASPAYYADRLCERARMYMLPLLRSRHNLRPTDDTWLLAGLDTVDPTEEQKADHVAELISSHTSFWAGPGRTKAPIANRMFYI